MSDVAWVAPAAAAAGVVVTAGAAWALGRRQRSGRIETSEAASLWEESKAIRSELRAEADNLRLRLAEAETRLAETLQRLAETNTRLVETNMKLMTAHNQADLLREEVRELRRICGRTNADVQAVSRELHVIRSDSPQADQARKEAEGT